jgi:hypothetical protein
MEWNRSDSLGLATVNCLHCKGTGLRTGEKNPAEPCNCVLRKIFRICYARFVECTAASVEGARCSLENAAFRELPGEFSRKNEEYAADFILIAKRTLNPELHRIFRYRYILGADWRLCCRKLNMDRGRFYQLIYLIQQKLGRVYRELEPYSLYPLEEYFCPGMRTRSAGPIVALRPSSPSKTTLRPLPLGRAA